MAIRVPRYDSPTVQTENLPMPMARPVPAEAFGAGLSKGLNDLEDVFRKEREKEELTALNEAKLDMETYQSEITDGRVDDAGVMQGGLLTRKGTAAKGLEKEARPLWEKRFADNAEKLRSYPAARQLFQQWNQSAWTKTAVTLNKHEMAERQTAAVNSQKAIIEKTQEKVIADVSKGGAFDFTSLQASARTMGQLNGLGDDEIGVYTENLKSKTVASAITQLMDSGQDVQIKRGLELFEAHKDALDPDDRKRLEPGVVQTKQAIEGETEAQKIWSAHGPKGLNDPVNYVEFDKVLKGIPDKAVRDMAERELNTLGAKWNRTQSEYRQSNVSTVYDMIMQRKPMKSIIASAAFQGLPKDAQFSLKNTIESEYEIGTGGGGGGRGGSGVSSEVKGAVFENLMEQIDNGAVVFNSPKDAYQFVDKLGVGYTNKLASYIRRHQAAIKSLPGGSQEFRRTFKDTLADLHASGVDVPLPDSRNQKDAQTRAEIYNAVHATILSEQSLKSRVLTSDEVQKTMRKIIAPVQVRGTQYVMGIPLYKTTITKPRYKVQNPGALTRETIAGDLAEILGRQPSKVEIDAAERRLKGGR